jgi:hypothetical protein
LGILQAALGGWFPGLGDRSTFVRQAANLWRVKQLLHEQLLMELGARTADCHLIDGFPLKVCYLTTWQTGNMDCKSTFFVRLKDNF